MRGGLRRLVASLLLVALVPTFAATTTVQAPSYEQLSLQLVELRVKLAVLEGKATGSVLDAEESVDGNETVLMVDEATGVVEAVPLKSKKAQMAMMKTTTAAPTVKVHGIKVKAVLFEMAAMAIVLMLVGVLWVLPKIGFCRKYCESKMYIFFWIILTMSLLVLGAGFNELESFTFNGAFFAVIKGAELAINTTRQVLVGFAALVVMLALWKFKDRIFEAMGIENPHLFLGEFRDWATCWSMRRFSTMEIFVLKVEGLPAMKVASSNDVYCEVNWGYNVTGRTRVHPRAGERCIFKESIQLNWDPYDTETTLHIAVRNQDIVGATDIASLHLGTRKVATDLVSKDIGAGRTMGWGATSVRSTYGGEAWNAASFKSMDLIPAGKIWIKFVKVED